jgi:hypothetical protein
MRKNTYLWFLLPIIIFLICIAVNFLFNILFLTLIIAVFLSGLFLGTLFWFRHYYKRIWPFHFLRNISFWVSVLGFIVAIFSIYFAANEKIFSQYESEYEAIKTLYDDFPEFKFENLISNDRNLDPDDIIIILDNSASTKSNKKAIKKKFVPPWFFKTVDSINKITTNNPHLDYSQQIEIPGFDLLKVRLFRDLISIYNEKNINITIYILGNFTQEIEPIKISSKKTSDFSSAIAKINSYNGNDKNTDFKDLLYFIDKRIKLPAQDGYNLKKSILVFYSDLIHDTYNSNSLQFDTIGIKKIITQDSLGIYGYVKNLANKDLFSNIYIY